MVHAHVVTPREEAEGKKEAGNGYSAKEPPRAAKQRSCRQSGEWRRRHRLQQRQNLQ